MDDRYHLSSYADMEKLLKQFPHHNDSFMTSAAYFYLTGRKGCWVYKNDVTMLICCIHPNQPDTILVFPECGKVYGTLTCQVIFRLLKNDYKIQLARYTDADMQALKNSLKSVGFSRRIAIDITDEELLDWQFPQHIIDVNAVATLRGNRFEHIRNKVNKIHGDIEICPLNDPNSLRALRSVIYQWHAAMVWLSKDDQDDFTGFYDRIVAAQSSGEGLFDGLIFFHNNLPVGFAAWDYATETTSNSLACISNTQAKGLSEYQIVSVCRALQKKGINYLNLGGSEMKSLDEYKQKFRPVMSQNIYSSRVIERTYIAHNVDIKVMVPMHERDESIELPQQGAINVLDGRVAIRI